MHASPIKVIIRQAFSLRQRVQCTDIKEQLTHLSGAGFGVHRAQRWDRIDITYRGLT